jgi:hypothetical protein
VSVYVLASIGVLAAATRSGALLRPSTNTFSLTSVPPEPVDLTVGRSLVNIRMRIFNFLPWHRTLDTYLSSSYFVKAVAFNDFVQVFLEGLTKNL